MDNMFKLMGWWTGIFAVMFFHWRHATCLTYFCCEHGFLLTSWVFEPFRTYVYVYFRSLPNGFHGWIQLLYNIHSRTRYALKSTYKKTASNWAVFLYVYLEAIQKRIGIFFIPWRC